MDNMMKTKWSTRTRRTANSLPIKPHFYMWCGQWKLQGVLGTGTRSLATYDKDNGITTAKLLNILSKLNSKVS